VNVVFETLGLINPSEAHLDDGPSIDPELREGDVFWITDHEPGPLDRVELQFRGLVEVIADGYWVVHGLEIRVTSQTVIVGHIQFGSMVKVTAAFGDGHRLVARKIELTGDRTGEGEGFVFKGIVESIADPIWIIAAHDVIVTQDTEIVDSIGVGDFVKVHAIFAGTDRFIALRIEPAERPGDKVIDDLHYVDQDNEDHGGQHSSNDSVPDSSHDGDGSPSNSGPNGNQDGDQDGGTDRVAESVDQS
jgi:hypothetical protein